MLTVPRQDSYFAESPPPTYHCDFCDGDATVLYRARSTETRIARGVSVTFTRTCWRACETCKTLIAAGRRDELAARGTAAYLDRQPLTGNRQQRRAAHRALCIAARRTHDDFWRARVDATPVSLDAATEHRGIAAVGAS